MKAITGTLILIVLGTLVATTTIVAAAPPAGGWIGWADLGDGGDLSLRVWLEEGPDGPAAWFDGDVIEARGLGWGVVLDAPPP